MPSVSRSDGTNVGCRAGAAQQRVGRTFSQSALRRDDANYAVALLADSAKVHLLGLCPRARASGAFEVLQRIRVCLRLRRRNNILHGDDIVDSCAASARVRRSELDVSKQC